MDPPIAPPTAPPPPQPTSAASVPVAAAADEGAKTKRRARIACIQCRQKRGRCDGTNPCTPCRRQNTPCTYSRSDRRLWISQSDYLQLVEERDTLKKQCDELKKVQGPTDKPLGAAAGPSSSSPSSSTMRPPADRDVDLAQPAVDVKEEEEDALSEGGEAAGRLLSDERGSARESEDFPSSRPPCADAVASQGSWATRPALHSTRP